MIDFTAHPKKLQYNNCNISILHKIQNAEGCQIELIATGKAVDLVCLVLAMATAKSITDFSFTRERKNKIKINFVQFNA